MYESAITPYISDHSYLSYIHIFCHFTWFFKLLFLDQLHSLFSCNKAVIGFLLDMLWIHNFMLRVWTIGHIFLSAQQNKFMAEKLDF